MAKKKKKAAAGGIGFVGVAVAVLFAARAWSVRFGDAFDCDEAMNYYEPAHFLLHGRGLQTWEYAPRYALRTYAYVAAYAHAGKALSNVAASAASVATSPVAEFYGVRAFAALLSAAAEALLVARVRSRVGRCAGALTLAFLALSPGMHAASAAFLPSATAMALVCAAYALRLGSPRALWLPGLCACAAVLCAWPFAGLAVVPLGVAFLARFGPLRTCAVLCACSALVALPLALVDSRAFGLRFPVVAAWNIVRYNVLGGGSAALYGTAPWHFYVASGVLGLGVALPLALLCAPLLALLPACRGTPHGRAAQLLAPPVALWFVFMSAQAHKEERFLYVVYPLACACAGIALDAIVGWIARGRHRVVVRSVLLALAMGGFAAMSVSRIAALRVNYGAAMAAWHHLGEVELAGTDTRINVCVGKEWYRFPGSFFLPGPNVQLRFVRSNFHGQLPQPFGNHTWSEPAQPFNDVNAEEPSRYTPVEQCHYLVDCEFEGQSEPFYSHNTATWRVIWEAPFLDAAHSPRATRSFFLPRLSPKHNAWSRYLILRNDQLILQSVSSSS